MDVPYTAIFLGLLLAYMVYSQWVGLDSRYPIAAALVLLVIAAITDAVGAVSLANILAIFVFFLLGAGVILLLVDHVRSNRAVTKADATRSATAESPSPKPAQKPQPAAQHALNRLQK